MIKALLINRVAVIPVRLFKAYIHHLFKAHELLAYRLASIHNIYFMMKLMKEIREAIQENRLEKLKAEWL